MSEIPNDAILDKMENVLKIASDFTRLKILYSILDEEKSVNDIAFETGASQSLVSHQLAVLKRAHLVSVCRRGHSVFYRLEDDHVEKLLNITYEHVTED